jgi:hypothetical protein
MILGTNAISAMAEAEENIEKVLICYVASVLRC